MAIENIVGVGVMVRGDGVSTTFSFDLVKDPYEIITGKFGGGGNVEAGDLDPIGSTVVNWFAKDRTSTPPSGVSSYWVATGITVSSITISGTVVTITFSSAPANGATPNVVLYLLF